MFDGDVKFVNYLLRKLWSDTNMKLSSAFHPRINHQKKVTNRNLGDLLRNLFRIKQGNSNLNQ